MAYGVRGEGRIHRSIDEIIRFAFDSVGGPLRYAVRDFELRGSAVARGDAGLFSRALNLPVELG